MYVSWPTCWVMAVLHFFSQTPTMQLGAVVNINQKDLVHIVLSEKLILGGRYDVARTIIKG